MDADAGANAPDAPDAVSEPPHDAAASDTVAGLGCPTLDGASFASVSALLQGAADGGLGPLGLIVVTRCGVLWQESVSAGDRSLPAVVPLASATKMPTAMVLMNLADESKLALDDKVGKFIPGWPADKAAITLRELLSHTSGLATGEGGPFGGAKTCLDDLSTTLEACAAEVAATPLASPPGTAFLYGGYDYQVAGRIAEIAGGAPFVTLFRDRVATPCGLGTFVYNSATNPRLAGGAATSLGDYGKLLRAHLTGGLCDGGRVLSAAAVEEMRRDQTHGAPGIASSPEPFASGYGFGWWLTTNDAAVNDAGAFGAIPWIDPRLGYGALLLAQSSLRSVMPFWRQTLKPALDAKLGGTGR